MTQLEDIICFLVDLSGDKIKPDTDLFQEAGITGDDFHEMMEKYADRYSVDMSGYLWYFHTCEEGCSGLGGAFFPPPDKRVDRIPVTPAMLADFANKGKWDISYPEHKLPKRRYDVLFNWIVLILSLLFGILVALFR